MPRMDVFVYNLTKKGARGFINQLIVTHCTLKTRQEWVDIVDEYATAKGIVVLATDYVGDTFEHNGKGFTYDLLEHVPVISNKNKRI